MLSYCSFGVNSMKVIIIFLVCLVNTTAFSGNNCCTGKKKNSTTKNSEDTKTASANVVPAGVTVSQHANNSPVVSSGLPSDQASVTTKAVEVSGKTPILQGTTVLPSDAPVSIAPTVKTTNVTTQQKSKSSKQK